MNKILLSAFLFLSLATAPAAAAISAPDLDAVTRGAYPDADAVLVLADDFYDVRPDGTYLNVEEQWTKVLTEKGRREEGVIELGYNARYATARILSVAIIGTDGVRREVDFGATTKEMSSNSSSDSNIYDPQERRIVCAVPGLKVGETLCCRMEKDVRKARVENNYSDIFIMEWSAPIVKTSVRVRVPKTLPLKSVSVRNPVGNVTSTETEEADGSILYTWTAANSPQAFPEPDMPPIYTQLQNVRVSTAADWQEISRWYWNLSVPHLEKANPAITNKVNEIISALGKDGAGGDALRAESVAAIYKWVAQEIRYMGLTMEDTSPGYAPHDVSVTFDNRYGVCRDKAALLVAMLRIAGFEAFPVLIHAGAKMDEEVPLPFFNHAIVAVRDGGNPLTNKDGFVLMDPTNESSRDLFPSYLCDRSYLVATPEGEGLHLSQIVPPGANAVKVDSEGTIDADGSMLLETKVAISGINDNAYRGRFLELKPDERRKSVERIVRNAAPGAELISLEIKPDDLQDTATPMSLKFTARIPEAVLRGGTLDQFSPPLLSRSLGLANFLLQGSTSLDKRRFPLDLSSTAMTDERLVVRHGGNLGAVSALPEDVSIGNDGGPYVFRLAFEAADESVTVTRRLSIGSVEFSPAEYAEMRESVKRVEAAEKKRLFFSKNADRDADVRYRLLKTDCAVVSPFVWTVTNTVEKEILTYDGKKSSAELTFSWNPTWKNVELVYATVSNRNGRVSSVSEREMNVFDCKWAASAPRYPASKELVVNLPSVEVGSVISYRTVTTVSNSPSAFYSTFFYDVFEPTEKLVQNCILPDGTAIANAKDAPAVLKRESMQPDGRLWRDHRTVSLGCFKSLAARLGKACEVKGVTEKSIDLGQTFEFPEFAGILKSDSKSGRRERVGKLSRVKAVRDWMYRNVRVTGPALYEVPLADQLADPETVLKERYATRLDYVRTLAALLKGAGFAADVVFAASDSGANPRLRDDIVSVNPCEKAFAYALCRVRVRTGGFLGFFTDETTLFLGHENEYTPLGATAFDGADCLDPATGEIFKVRIPCCSLAERGRTRYEITLRENGAADIDVLNTIHGPGAGTFRKSYAEMLPEDRSRHYQELLGAISQAASATSDLITDVDAYPATMRFSCYVPNYATVDNGTMTLTLPEMGAHVFPLTGSKRETPIATGPRDASRLDVVVRFPEGYTLAETLPEGFTIDAPQELPETGCWYRYESGSGEAGGEGGFAGHFSRQTFKRENSVLSPIWFEYLKSVDGRATSRANRTVSARKVK